jgi:hypothetical protein
VANTTTSSTQMLAALVALVALSLAVQCCADSYSRFDAREIAVTAAKQVVTPAQQEQKDSLGRGIIEEALAHATAPRKKPVSRLLMASSRKQREVRRAGPPPNKVGVMPIPPNQPGTPALPKTGVQENELYTNSSWSIKKIRFSTTCYNRKYKMSSLTGIEWEKELIAAASKLSRNNSIVVTGGDWAYRATVLNWMAHADNIGMTEYIVLCYGTDMLQLVGSWEDGGHGILVSSCTQVFEFMYMKLVGLYHLHTAKYIVTWSDCDALWLRPFMDEWILPYKDKVDFLSQKALYPGSISRKTGSVICTGLFTVFPTPRANKVMQRIAQVVPKYRGVSDQSLVNKYLNELGAFAFTKKVVLFDDIDSEQLVVIPKYTNSRSPKLGFLPFGLFPRSRTKVEWARVQDLNPALWHGYLDKVGQSKVDGMKSSSVFALKDGWEQLTNASAVPAFFDKSVLTNQKWRNVSISDSELRSIASAMTTVTTTEKRTRVYTTT